jgi:hypothetical protein
MEDSNVEDGGQQRRGWTTATSRMDDSNVEDGRQQRARLNLLDCLGCSPPAHRSVARAWEACTGQARTAPCAQGPHASDTQFLAACTHVRARCSRREMQTDADRISLPLPLVKRETSYKLDLVGQYWLNKV